MTLTVGSLFAGIGGIELGLEWTGGFRTVWQVEKDEYCRRVLARHWPNAERFDDVCTVGAHNLAPVDVICGGFPCQDISNAGKRAGIDGERSGLWREYARVVRELRPRYVLVENVAALLGRGLGVVLGDLAACGYDAEWSVLSAQNVGAPHLRERLFVIAYAVRDGQRNEPQCVGGSDGTTVAPHDGTSQPVANAIGGERDSGSGRQSRRDGAEPSGAAVADAESDGLTISGAGHARRDARASRLQQLRGESRGSGADAGTSVIPNAESDGRGQGRTRRSDPGRAGQRIAVRPLPDAAGEGPSHRIITAIQGRSEPGRSAIKSQRRDWWSVEPDVGRVAARVSPGMDGSLNAHTECIEEARAKGLPSTQRLQSLRELVEAATPSHEWAGRCHLCGHPLSALPCSGACAPWRLGSGGASGENLRCLREGLLGLLAHEGQDVQPFLSVGDGATQRTQAVGSRIDRLRALGNAVVPQCAEFVGRLILDMEQRRVVEGAA